jgi:hypothetical protein
MISDGIDKFVRHGADPFRDCPGSNTGFSSGAKIEGRSCGRSGLVRHSSAKRVNHRPWRDAEESRRRCTTGDTLP